MELLEPVDDVETAKRREKLLARLTQKDDTLKSKIISSETKVREAESDQLLNAVRAGLENGNVDDEDVKRLEEIVATTANSRRTKLMQETLEKVRSFRLARSQPTSKAFSFAKSGKPQKTSTVSTPRKEKREEIAAETQLKLADVDDSNVIENLEQNKRIQKDERRTIDGSDGTDVSLKNVDGCRIEFAFRPSAVHMRNIKNSTILFLPCARSILMHDCVDVCLFAAAQQIRVHTSTRLQLHVALRGAAILEECTDVQMSPYSLESKEGEPIEAEDNGEWRRPRDFDWLAEGPSPNWSVSPEAHWTTERFLH